ncbi:MAG: hypothetical protein SVU32_05335, partial [Candidatus Nanohaloarchaea archaeon]|nr:hypothetical protein [Candidatus Nanohaloarchaea archaeon]
GIRNTFIYSIGQIQCVEAGIKTPLDTPKNDDFRMGATIRSVNVTATDGSVSRGRAPVTTVRRVMFNRYWFLYKVLKNWLNTEASATPNGLKDSVRAEIQDVKDQAKRTNTFCRDDKDSDDDSQETPSDWCKKNNKFPQPRMKQGHIQDLDQAVAAGLEKEMTRLEEHEDYFGGHDVSCTTYMNRKNGYSYPGFDIIKTNVKKTQIKGSKCGCMSGDREWIPDDPGPPEDEGHYVCHDKKFNYYCKTEWDVVFNARLDYTLTCTDNKYRSVPRDRLSKVAWSIDLSYVIQERHIGGGTYN